MRRSTLSRRAALLALALPFVLLSCSSTAGAILTNDHRIPLYGMVYDGDNSPVADAAVFIGGTATTKSDVNGRFVLVGLNFGQYDMVVKKNYFEPATLALDYSTPTQVLYVKLVSVDELLAAADKDIDAREWSKAEDRIARVLALRHGDPAALYLSAVIAFRKGDSAAARTTLEKLLADDYREPAVYLFLADIFQYKDKDPAGAAERLKEYLALRYDPDAEARLGALPGK